VKAKKKLITRMAIVAAGVLVAALLVAASAFFRELSAQERWDEGQKDRRREIAERSRGYLTELAKKIDGVPVDPILVSEVEAHYFEELDNGPLAVWAMGTDGAFLFGVPREAFARMNAIYDREITPRLKEGIFFDRQSFFLGHLEGDETSLLRELSADEMEEDDGGVELLERLERHSDRADTVVLSAPLKSGDGAALGSVYMKRSAPRWEGYRGDERLRAVAAFSGALAMLSFVFLWLLLPSWVYVDARERGVRRAFFFAALTVISSLVGLVVYLIARPEQGPALACSGCGREVDGGAYCPHCGRDLSSSICATCRYPLKADWAFCPSCRTEIKPPAGAEPSPAAG